MRIRTAGEICQGRRVPGDSQGTPPTAWRQSSRAVAVPGTAIAPPREGPARPVPEPEDGGWPHCKLHSARRHTPGQAASGRGQSNQVLSEVLRAGRASTAGLSPLSTPDSILMCYRYRARTGCVENRWGAHWCFYDRHMQDKAVAKTISAD